MPVPRITREELKAKLDSPDSSLHPVIVDVRLKYPYEHSTVTLPGAIRVLPDNVATASLARDREIVLYDSDPGDIVSSQCAAELLRRGYRAMVLQGGINEWMTAKLPVATKSAPQPAAPAAKPAAPAAARPAAPAAPKPAPPRPDSASAAASKAPTPAAVEGPTVPAPGAPDRKEPSNS